LPTIPTQRQPVVASVFCAWPVYFVQSTANGVCEVGAVWPACAPRESMERRDC